MKKRILFISLLSVSLASKSSDYSDSDESSSGSGNHIQSHSMEHDMPGLVIERDDMPNVDIPNLDMPQQNMPQQNMPQYNMPQQNMPQYNMPQQNMPQQNMPQLNMPQQNMPQHNMPQQNMPKSDMLDKNIVNETVESDISALDFHLLGSSPNQSQKIDFIIKASNVMEPRIDFRLESPGKEEPVVASTVPKPETPDGRRHGHKSVLRSLDRYPTYIVKHKIKTKGGNVTDTKNFPYVAAIIVNGKVWCAGALVDENWVITAAHCLNYVLHVSPLRSVGHFVKVRVGSAFPHEGGLLIDVAGVVRHPKFEEEPVPHADVALLKLAENVPFGKFIDLIKIYQGTKEPYAQSFVVVAGWGASRGSDTAFREHTPDMRFGRLKVRSQHYCVDAYQLVNGFQFTDDFFCASLRNGTRDACLFDAGAPAVQQNSLVGIMSFGPERCGHEFQPAVFIKAFYFRDFVKSTISSYKTTKELIEAMRDADPELTVAPLNLKTDEDKAVKAAALRYEQVTRPDDKHD
ncbi:trypsin-1-like [Anticarsia gemmatalis]|uniref:trypsin-1-like n=1 Tax=Anticarsia gemmatalis TaxID=129554 RepID=UPI003F76DEC4